MTTTGAARTSAAAATTSSSTSGDLAIVSYALTLEYLESQFYAKVISSGLFHGSTLPVGYPELRLGRPASPGGARAEMGQSCGRDWAHAMYWLT